jgi:hypothetical protein
MGVWSIPLPVPPNRSKTWASYTSAKQRTNCEKHSWTEYFLTCMFLVLWHQPVFTWREWVHHSRRGIACTWITPDVLYIDIPWQLSVIIIQQFQHKIPPLKLFQCQFNSVQVTSCSISLPCWHSSFPIWWPHETLIRMYCFLLCSPLHCLWCNYPHSASHRVPCYVTSCCLSQFITSRSRCLL